MGIIFPRGFAFAIDDLGWNEGSDLSQSLVPGPYRCGVNRKFDLNDYRCLVEVAKAVGARIQCLFILSEMDRENILRKFPTTTWQRDQWDNSHLVNDEQVEIIRYVSKQSAYMEFGLHGVGHEYWAPGQVQKRAEWYNLIDRKPWPEESLAEHIHCFKEIMEQYGLSKSNGHSFPESFVPCAYSYYWNPKKNYSLGKLLANAGVKYANTDFSQIPELNPPQGINAGGFDHGVHVINRLNYGNLWYELAKLPETPIPEQLTDIIESHWPNWLAQDDFLQPGVTRQWINYYKSVQQSEDRYIAKNTEQLHSQWLYNHYTIIKEVKTGLVSIDNSAMPDEAYHRNLLGNLVLKIKLKPGEHINKATLNNNPVGACFEEMNYAYLYLPPLEKQKYELSYEIGKLLPNEHIFVDGTYNVYSFDASSQEIKFNIRVYGEQEVRIKCLKPKSVKSLNDLLKLINYTYDEETGYLILTLKASDMQGTTGKIVIQK